MILSIIAAAATAGVVYTVENAAQRGIKNVINTRKASKAGYVPATAYPASVPMLPPMMQQPIMSPPMMQPPFMQQAAADTAAAQQAAAEAAPAAASTTQAPTAQPVVNLDDMFTKIIDLVDDKLTAVAAQSAPTQPEAGPFSVGKKVAIIGIFNDAGICVDLDGKEIDDIEKIGVVHSATDPVTFIVTVKKKGKSNEYENRRFSKDMIGPMV